MGRFFLYFFATTILVIGGAWVWVLKEPMSFLDQEYPVWKAKMDMAADLPPDSVVILGDSRPMFGLIPSLLRPDVVNLAVTGGSPIEALAFARLVLTSPHPPRAILLSIGPIRCSADMAFWEKGVKYDLFDWATIEEARQRSRRYHDRVLNDLDNLNPADLSPLFGPETLDDIDARVKTTLYSLHFPSYYFAALTGGRICLRGATNAQIYRDIRKSRGRDSFAIQSGCRDLSPETMVSAFEPAPLLDSYLSDLLTLFQSRNIPVYFIGCPISDLSTAALHPGFAAEYAAYFENYAKQHPNFHLLGDPLPTLPWSDFGDNSHLNDQGAEVFSDQVALLLQAAGIEK